MSKILNPIYLSKGSVEVFIEWSIKGFALRNYLFLVCSHRLSMMYLTASWADACRFDFEGWFPRRTIVLANDHFLIPLSSKNRNFKSIRDFCCFILDWQDCIDRRGVAELRADQRQTRRKAASIAMRAFRS